MECQYAALLLHTLDQEVTLESVAPVLEAAGATVSRDRLVMFLEDIGNTDIKAVTSAPPPQSVPEVVEEVPEEQEIQ